MRKKKNKKTVADTGYNKVDRKEKKKKEKEENGRRYRIQKSRQKREKEKGKAGGKTQAEKTVCSAVDRL